MGVKKFIAKISEFAGQVKELELDKTFGAGQNPFPSLSREELLEILGQNKTAMDKPVLAATQPEYKYM